MSDRYIIEREFEHAGYKCVVIFGSIGHRCGYVGIPKNHPLYGKDYSDHLEIKKADVGDREVSGIFPLLGACLDEDERIQIEAYFQCHGGITYAGGGEHSSYQRDNSNEYQKRANFPENIEFSGISLYSDKSIRHRKNTRNFNGN